MKTDNEESKECKECNGIKKCKSSNITIIGKKEDMNS